MSDNLIINEFKEILDEQSLQKLEHFLDEDNASFCDAQNEINGHEQVACGLKLDTENKETATFFPFLSLESESKTESEEVTTCIDGRNVGKNIRPVSD